MKRKVLLLAAGAAVSSLWASFGALTPPARPSEREFIWPEGKMPNAQAHQIAAKTREAKAPGFSADNARRPYLEWYLPAESAFFSVL